MKENYFSPEANLMEYNYTNVVSASHDLPPARHPPRPRTHSRGDVPATK